jgi:hypothetical protein
MNRELTFEETIDQILDAMPDQDAHAIAALRAAMIIGALEAERRMSLSKESAAALCKELHELEINIAIRDLAPEA